MGSYIKPHMRESLKNHVLIEQEPERHYVLRIPERSEYLTHILFAARRIIITGDLCIGPTNGVISNVGYGLGWFSTKKSEDYLCEKFLRQQWQDEAAAETIRWWLEIGEEPYQSKREELESIADKLECGEMDSRDLYDALDEAGIHCDDGIPGMDYPRADAGWLCAINQLFAEKYTELDDRGC